jgi:PAS domain S-box-containing protein
MFRAFDRCVNDIVSASQVFASSATSSNHFGGAPNTSCSCIIPPLEEVHTLFSSNDPGRFSQNLAITAVLTIVLATTFGMYVRREEEVSGADKVRLTSLQLANELRQSSGDLTRMARSYVSTGDSAYRKYYQSILDIRDGKALRPQGYSSIDADLVKTNATSNSRRGKPIALLESMRLAGFTAAEFQKLAKAKANSDLLTRIEFEAMGLASSTGPTAAADRALAVRLLYDDRYNREKASIMRPIDDFLLAVDSRTQAAVDHAETMATILRFAFIAVGIALILMLWSTYATLRKLMGGSVDDVYRQIAALGSGSFVAAPLLQSKNRGAMLGWLSEARIRLNDAQLARAVDATNRAQGEEALRQSVQRTRLILDNALDAVITMGSSGVISDWNAQAERMFGWSRAEAVGQQMSATIIPERYRARHEQGLKKFLETGEGPVLNKRIEITALHRDGHELPVELAISPAKVGEHWTFSAFLRDLTERKKAEEALKLTERSLQASERRLIQILETVPLGILVSDEKGSLMFANAGAQKILGKGIVAGVGIDELAHVYQAYLAGTDQLYPVDRMPLVRALAGEAVTVEDMEIRHGDRVISITVKGAPILNSEGQIVAAVVAFIDITERRALESQVGQTSKMEAVGQLAGGVAHDFNNLLTVIMSYGAMLLERLDPGEDREDVQEIATAADRAAGLTRQLLAFSRQQVMQPRVMDVNDVIGGLEKMLHRLIGEDVELTIMLDPGLEAINADPGQLEQVLMNLVVNARDAMPVGGRLTISTSNSRLSAESAAGTLHPPAGDYVTLTVGDTGTGMSRAIQARIFDPFFTTKGQGRGTGLGLATVYGIVKQSGGEIYVYSEVGQGSTFKIYFPRFILKTEDRPHDVVETEPSGGSESILLVEDDSTLRALVARVLKRRGYTVHVAGSGVEALVIASDPALILDAVITDVVMPGMNGRELVEKLLESRPGMGSLLMSGYTDDDVLRRGVLQGETAFLQKPFTPDQLSRKVRAVLDRAIVDTVV